MVVLEAIFISLVSTLIFIGINGFILLWISRWFAFKKQDSKTSYSVAGIAGAVSFVLSLIPIAISALAGSLLFSIVLIVVNALILIWLIMKFYNLKFLKAGLAWIIIFVIDIIIGFILGLILALIAGALGPGFGAIIY